MNFVFQSRLSVEETVKPSEKKKKSVTIAANYDQTQFVCNLRILTEICVNGMNDLASKVIRLSSFFVFILKISRLRIILD